MKTDHDLKTHIRVSQFGSKKNLHDWFDAFITGVLDDSWLDVVNQLKEQNDMNKNLEVTREKDIFNVY